MRKAVSRIIFTSWRLPYRSLHHGPHQQDVHEIARKVLKALVAQHMAHQPEVKERVGEAAAIHREKQLIGEPAGCHVQRQRHQGQQG